MTANRRLTADDLPARTPNDGARLARVRRLFDAADRLPRHAQDAWVHAAAGDAALAREVLDLLALADSETAIPTPASLLADLRDADPDDDMAFADPMLDARIGPYRVLRLLGRGGMGAVYEARREDADFTLRVALKLLRPGAESEAAIRRFRFERRVLASLRHPNIAALLDGGMTDDGRPYFVMEFVEGDPITRWADAHALDVPARVRLVRQVCDAVQHAHAHLVVHRDLKPANILVDARGVVRLLDFGIARLVQPADADDTGAESPPTETVVRTLTPEYASPEQFLGAPAQVASDVYSLGVVLYELLAGVRPYTLSGLSWPAMVSRLTEGDVPPPSRAPEATLADSDAIRQRRAKLRGDLDAIVLQAIARQPAQRYATVDQLAQELDAWLAGRPVRARRPSVGYRVGKLLRRRPLEIMFRLVIL